MPDLLNVTDIFDQLTAVREIKINTLGNMFIRWERDILFISHMDRIRSDITDLSAGFKFLGSEKLRILYNGKPELADAGDGSGYSAVHREEQHFFNHYIGVQGY